MRWSHGPDDHRQRVAQTVANAVIDVELDRLDRSALKKYFEDLANAEKTDVGPDAINRPTMQLGLGLMGDLLKGSPEIRVKQLGVQTALGSVSGSAIVSFSGKDFARLGSSVDLFQRVRFNGAAEMSGTLLRAWMAKDARAQAVAALARQGAAADDAQLRALWEKLVQDQVAALAAVGLIKPQGDKFVLRAEFTEGKLLLNGVSGDQFLGGMLAPRRPRVPDRQT